MRRRERLVREAREAIRFRGHVMRRFRHTEHGATYDCPCCEAGITIRLRPMPNEIDLGGEALAVHCPGAQLAMYRGGQ